MTARDFVYWLQGLLELSPDTTQLNGDQVKMIRDHLKYVFDNPHLQANTPIIFPAQEPGLTGPQQFQWPPVQPLTVTC